MALTGWNDRLRVGHSVIDSEHIKLTDLLDQLEDAVTNHQGLETYGKVLDRLIVHTQEHFAMEERLMAEHHYAQAEQHTREHEQLLQQLIDFKARFEAKAVILSIAQLKLLEEEWQNKHIMESDKALAEAIPAD